METGLLSVAFWVSAALIAYTYLGYPLWIALVACYRPRAVRRRAAEPRVAVVIAAWNEADVIGRRLENLLALDYPEDRLVILIGSDGSDDGTARILSECRDPRLVACVFPERRGKPLVLNDLVERAREAGAEILVLGDARQSFAPDAIRELVSNFSDPSVGTASGELVLREGSEASARGVGAYWRYELFLRRCESTAGSMLGATGAIYAIRAELFPRLPADLVLDDMYVPLSAVARGYRAILDGEARAYDTAARAGSEEWRRKVRTIFGNFQILTMFPGLLVPFASPVWWQLVSHKLLRALMPLFLVAALVLSAALAWSGSAVHAPLLGMQLSFYSAAALGALLSRGGLEGALAARLTAVPYMFCLLNAAALVALGRYLWGGQSVRWAKARARKLS